PQAAKPSPLHDPLPIGLPEIFAEGAATATPQARKISPATLIRGIRPPIVSTPAVTITGTAAALFKTTVNGPGKNESMNKYADERSEEHTSELQSRGHLV